MSNIKKLLKGVEVEWKTLENCCNILDNERKPITKSARLPGKHPYYGANGIQDYVLNYIFDGKFVLVGEDGSVLTVNGTPVVTWAEGKIWVNNHAHIIKETEGVLLRYLFHYIKTINISKLIHGNIPKLTGKDFRSLLIPIPCPDDPEKSLEIQKEIVCILDKFSTLTAELQAELQARKSQYEYYRNQLLTYPMEESDQPSLRSSQSATSIQNSDNPTQPFSTPNPHTGNSVLQPHNKVEWKTLGEIGTFIRGNGLQKKDFMESGVPCIHYGQIYTHYGTFATQTKSFVNKETARKCKKAHKGDLIIASTSENVEDVGKTVAWLGDDDVAISNHTLIYSHNQNPKYLAYLFQTEAFMKYKMTKIVGVKVIDIPQKALENFRIPIPSLKEQERIVSILDKFNILTTSITEGLPKEIELRQKQYEYYRDMLLTFPTDNIKA